MAAILVVAIATSTSIAVLTERIAYRPFRRVVGLAPLICAIGVSFFLEQTFRGMFGSAVKSYPEPQWERAAFHVLGFNVPRIDVLVIGLALVFMGGLYLIVQRTRMGTAMRAVAEDGEAAALMGIDVNKVVVFTFVLGGAMAGIAGVFYAFVYKQVYFFMGFTPGIKAFGAAVLGGIGNIPGAMLGGFFLGMVELVGTDAVPRRHRHSRTLPVARPDRLHAADHGADLPPARAARRTHGEEARMMRRAVPDRPRLRRRRGASRGGRRAAGDASALDHRRYAEPRPGGAVADRRRRRCDGRSPAVRDCSPVPPPACRSPRWRC